ncbi:MAG: AAA family ATPase [Candidatus Obscuribacterales bacterium]|nr:AAA family ATPase [Candidatus Obscuribacterales bacterium]
MFLKNIELKQFRSFESTNIELQKDLTVFVGENNGGKSNAIDAIRLLTSPLGGRREIYCESTDLRFKSSTSHFELVGRFAELSTGQQGRLISAVTDSSLTEACFGLRFDAVTVGSKPGIWAGREGNTPEPGCFEMVRHVYLPPLRDAKRSLASGNPTRIMALLNHFLEGTTAPQLAKDLARTHSHDVLSKVDKAVEKSLVALTLGVRRQSATLGFSTDEALIEIARDLRFRLADYGINPEDLRYSGHGYANLLFIATIAVELEKVRSADLTLFLVEEPEAHLHPQLQAAVLSFLQDESAQSRKHQVIDHAPSGELQVIVATHSPNLSAWVNSDRLVVFKSVVPDNSKFLDQESKPDPAGSGDTGTKREDQASAASSSVPAGAETDVTPAAEKLSAERRLTSCIALSKMQLNPVDRRKVDRYLDVTKAALLFAGRVLLVEGIAEALLFPAIAKNYTLKDDTDKLRVFRSAVFVPIDGVDFLPYATLLLTALNSVRIADLVVVVTDGDKGKNKKDELQPENEKSGTTHATGAGNQTKLGASGSSKTAIPGELRKTELIALAEKLGAEKHLAVITNTYSLEAELLEAGNGSILRKAYLTIHPKSQDKWDNAVALSGDERANKIYEIFKDTRKGDFAQVLAELIETGEDFKVPAYIAEAIKALVD